MPGTTISWLSATAAMFMFSGFLSWIEYLKILRVYTYTLFHNTEFRTALKRVTATMNMSGEAACLILYVRVAVEAAQMSVSELQC
jgi:hypothetical protein